jgi:UDP-glucuronate decarboxylase
MKILLAGAAGFLGSHITKKLLDLGHSVVGIDDLSTGNLNNLNFATNDKAFEFLEWDVRQNIEVQADFILNFACPASPVHYQSDPIKTIETNFLGTRNLLYLASQTGAKFMQASTSEIYGDPVVSPQSENYWGNVNPIGSRSCYDEGKRAAETLCFDYMRQRGVDVRVIRIFNTYGPNMAVGDGRVVSNFIVQCLQNENITIYGDGSQTRSFCYVDDLVDGILKFMNSELNPLMPLNLGNPSEFTMLELALEIQSLTNSSSEIIFKPLPEDDPKQRKPDIRQAQDFLGWSPKIALGEGLVRTIEYFKEFME